MMKTIISQESSISTPISQIMPISPRLGYTINLLTEVLESLREKRNKVRKNNKKFALCEDDMLWNNVNEEKITSVACVSLTKIKKNLDSISTIDEITKTLPAIIPIVRTLSSQLHTRMPDDSQKLCEISVHLGSIMVDSAILTGETFNFKSVTAKSTSFLDEVKLMVDSKINKLYPNLETTEKKHV